MSSKICPTQAKIQKPSEVDKQEATQNARRAKNHRKMTKKKKQIEENTAESQSIVVQDNSNPYNTSPKLSRLQMI